MHTTLRRTSILAGLMAAGLLLAGCGGTSGGAAHTGHSSGADQTASPSAGASSDSGPAADSGPVVAVSIDGDQVTPSGERIEVKVGQPVTFKVTSDRAGELHVHSAPEQELAYHTGKTTLKVTIDRPGVVDVEDHVAEVVVVQLQVS